ncbi:MAG: hypothetical protein GXY83_43840 [Rhodopirellula sp.]|nr:hypothetical protein [Rhodopirellula sp.]
MHQTIRASRAERAVIVLLRIYAAILLTALIPAVMPLVWMEEIHRGLGMGELPADRIVQYLTRSQSGLYAVQGALFLFISLNVRRLLPVVKCLAVLKILFGIGMLALDIVVGMPLLWTLGEGPVIIFLGCLLLGLTNRAAKNQGSAGE